jgi:hypothetical protein
MDTCADRKASPLLLAVSESEPVSVPVTSVALPVWQLSAFCDCGANERSKEARGLSELSDGMNALRPPRRKAIVVLPPQRPGEGQRKSP